MHRHITELAACIPPKLVYSPETFGPLTWLLSSAIPEAFLVGSYLALLRFSKAVCISVNDGSEFRGNNAQNICSSGSASS